MSAQRVRTALSVLLLVGLSAALGAQPHPSLERRVRQLVIQTANLIQAKLRCEPS